MSEIRRTHSLMALPSYVPRGYTYGTSTSYRVSTSPSLYTVRRVLSLPELYSTSYRYLPSYTPAYYRYYRDWDLRDDYWSDRRYYTSDRYWPYYGYPYRRYYSTSLDYNYPYSSYAYSFYRPYYSSYSLYNYDRPRYLSQYYYDYFDSWYWRRRLDPYWYRPWSTYSWYSRPWAYESAETDRAYSMYRTGMIGYDTFDRYYLSPNTYSRYSDYLKPYRPPIAYSSYPHYQYSIDYR